MTRSAFFLFVSLVWFLVSCGDLASKGSIKAGTYDVYSARVSPEPFFELEISTVKDTIVAANFRSLLDSVEHSAKLEVIKQTDDSLIFVGEKYQLRLANNEKPEGWLIDSGRRYAVLMELQQ